MSTSTPSPSVSNGPFVSTRVPMSRRHFLKGAGVALSLPLLQAMLPTLSRAAAPDVAKTRRFFAVMENLGWVPANFFPKGTGGFDYPLSPYLNLIKDYRNDFTVFSGTSLPNVSGSHPTEVAWLTGAPHPASGSFRNTISLDQVIAEHLGVLTRFPSLTLGINGNTSLSVTGSGVPIPPEQSAAAIYRLLFVQGSEAEIKAQILRLETGRSILDTINEQSKDLNRTLGVVDRERLDQFYTAVRQLEKNLQASQGWESKPKPKVSNPVPVDPTSPAQYMEKIKVMYDIALLALQTDSTRAITLFINSTGTPVIDGRFEDNVVITEGYHGLSHHGKQPDKLTQLRALDTAQFKLLNGLLNTLKTTPEDGETLLDHTQLLFGSNFYDANSHLTTNLPIIFAGGGWKHGQHLAFDTEFNYPLSNLHLSILRRMGIEDKSFSSSTGVMQGLDMVG